MKTTRNERLIEVAEKSGLSYEEFARKIGSYGQAIGSWKKNERPVPDKFIIKVIELWENVDARWLITGEQDKAIQEYRQLKKDYESKIKGIIDENEQLRQESRKLQSDLLAQKDEYIELLKTIKK